MGPTARSMSRRKNNMSIDKQPGADFLKGVSDEDLQKNLDADKRAWGAARKLAPLDAPQGPYGKALREVMDPILESANLHQTTDGPDGYTYTRRDPTALPPAPAMPLEQGAQATAVPVGYPVQIDPQYAPPFPTAPPPLPWEPSKETIDQYMERTYGRMPVLPPFPPLPPAPFVPDTRHESVEGAMRIAEATVRMPSADQEAELVNVLRAHAVGAYATYATYDYDDAIALFAEALKTRRDLNQRLSRRETLFTSLLRTLDPDASVREGLRETPLRAAKAWEEWTAGYSMEDDAVILKVFEDGAASYDEMVVVKDIPIYSKCEHHLADIFGTATIAYIPDGRVVGLSKLSRLANKYARRLQVQERLTVQIADALMTHLKPKGVGVVIRARHMCMESRGLCQQGHHTVTTALRGVMKDQPDTRAEFVQQA